MTENRITKVRTWSRIKKAYSGSGPFPWLATFLDTQPTLNLSKHGCPLPCPSENDAIEGIEKWIPIQLDIFCVLEVTHLAYLICYADPKPYTWPRSDAINTRTKNDRSCSWNSVMVVYVFWKKYIRSGCSNMLHHEIDWVKNIFQQQIMKVFYKNFVELMKTWRKCGAIVAVLFAEEAWVRNQLISSNTCHVKIASMV